MASQEAVADGHLEEIARNLASLQEVVPQLKELMNDLPGIGQQAGIAIQQLPELLRGMPEERRKSPSFPRLIYALATGAFDSAVNHAWNIAIEELRDKIRSSDIHLVRKDVNERKMLDGHVLSLCHSLNLIDEPTHFRLQQCGAVRNKFSTAHTAIGTLNVYECLAFMSNSCCLEFKASTVKAIDINEFMNDVMSGSMDDSKREFWANRISDTFDEQKKFILISLYEINCDYRLPSEVSLLAFDLCMLLRSAFTEEIVAEIEAIHHTYRFQEGNTSYRGSRWFYIFFGLASRLDDFERREMVLEYCAALRQAHQGTDGAQEEEISAGLLAKIVGSFEVPKQATGILAEVVVTCAIGHPDGSCIEAEQHYRKMIGNFSADAIRTTLNLPNSNTLAGERMEQSSTCQDRYRQVVGWLDSDNVPSDLREVYDNWCAHGSSDSSE